MLLYYNPCLILYNIVNRIYFNVYMTTLLLNGTLTFVQKNFSQRKISQKAYTRVRTGNLYLVNAF